jgi:hypothetical protein
MLFPLPCRFTGGAVLILGLAVGRGGKAPLDDGTVVAATGAACESTSGTGLILLADRLRTDTDEPDDSVRTEGDAESTPGGARVTTARTGADTGAGAGCTCTLVLSEGTDVVRKGESVSSTSAMMGGAEEPGGENRTDLLDEACLLGGTGGRAVTGAAAGRGAAAGGVAFVACGGEGRAGGVGVTAVTSLDEAAEEGTGGRGANEAADVAGATGADTGASCVHKSAPVDADLRTLGGAAGGRTDGCCGALIGSVAVAVATGLSAVGAAGDGLDEGGGRTLTAGGFGDVGACTGAAGITGADGSGWATSTTRCA